MANLTGMDIAEVRALSNQLRHSAGEIRTLIGQLNGKIESTQWIGADRNNFVGDWHGQYVPNLNHVVDALEAAAQRADANATEQEAASSH